MKKISLCFLLLFYFNLFAQNPANVSGCSVWIKQSKNTTNSPLNLKKDSLNFNKAIFFSDTERAIINKSKLKSTFTLFLVYKSNQEEENDILNYTVGNENLKISNKKVYSSLGIEYSKHNSEKGVIVSYSANLSSIKNSNICYLSFLDIKNQNNNSIDQQTSVFEFIFFPRILSATEKLKIESYLSIKYGVSLQGETNYLSSNNSKIWNIEQNKTFNSNVTGIARDDKSELFQKNSINAAKKGLRIGFGSYDSISKLEKKELNDNSYLVWGDNNKSVLFKKIEDQNSNDSIHKMERTWKMQCTISKFKENQKSFVVINPSVFFNNYKPKKDYTIWLVISPQSSEIINHQNSLFYPATVNKAGEFIFENVIWDRDKSGSDVFSFIEAPEMFFIDKFMVKDCNLSKNSTINLTVIGGSAPFSLTVKHDGYITNSIKNSRNFDIEIPTSGSYELTLVDAKKQSFTKTVEANSLEILKDFSSSDWYLNKDSEIEITPFLNLSTFDTKYSFSWQKENKVISNEKTLKVIEPGVYTLKITSEKGCEKNLAFNVIEKVSDDYGVTLYPNPVSGTEPFNLKFNLEKASDVEIKVYTINGALIKSEKLTAITDYNYSQTLQTSGSYLIVISTNTLSTTYKLIVN